MIEIIKMDKEKFWMKIESKEKYHCPDIFTKIDLQNISFKNNYIIVKDNNDEIIYEYALSSIFKIIIEEKVK